MISDSTIRLIQETARIEDVVGTFVNLKKRGTSLIGLCPFHNEKTPSFNVNITRGIYKCFGCGKGGDSVNFLMEHEKFTYPEALRYLAEKYNIEIEETESSADYNRENDDRESLFILNEFAKETFKSNLKGEEGRTIGLAYFFERGFREETIEKFDLGYSLQARSHFSEQALAYGFKQEFLEKSGLVFKTENGVLMDRFRARVMFPIHNQSGKVIAFGGRILKAAEKTAKYINSPETEFYQKSEVLYGLFQAKKAIRNLDNCLLAEGYTDVISLHQSGIENVVSSSGTSLTKQQIKLLSRFTQNVTILYDGDSAGIKASLRGIDFLLEEGLYVKVVLFPDNQDPDSYIRQVGGKAFSDYIQKEQKDFIAFKTEILLKEAQGDPIRKSLLVHDILESIAKVSDSVLATVYTHACSEKLEMDERILVSELNKIRLKKAKVIFPETEKTEALRPDHSRAPENQEGDSPSPSSEIPKSPVSALIPLRDDDQEEEFLRLLLNYGSYDWDENITVAQDMIAQIQDIEIENPLYIQFFNLVRDAVKKDPRLDPRPFIQSRNPEIKNLSVKLLSQKYVLSENWQIRHGIEVKREEDLIKESIDNCINHLKRRKLDTMIKENQEKLKMAQTAEEIYEIQSNHNILSTARQSLSHVLGVVVLK